VTQEYTNTCIKQFTKSHTLPPQLHFDPNVVYTDHNKVELFNQFFLCLYSVGVANSQEPNPDELCLPNNSLDAKHLTESDVFNALVNLNPHTIVHPVFCMKNHACALAAPLHVYIG